MSFWTNSSLAMSNNVYFSNNFIIYIKNCSKNTHCLTLRENYLSKWHLKPYMSSGTKDASKEIHVDHIHRMFRKNVSKFCICWFLPNWLWNFWYWKFFHVFFFKLFTIESFTNKDKLLRLVSIKRIFKKIFSKIKLFKNLKIQTF